MVSNASEDLPEPDRPVITINWSRGRSRSMFLRLCVRAPRMRMVSIERREEVMRRGKNCTIPNSPGQLLPLAGSGEESGGILKVGLHQSVNKALGLIAVLARAA